MPPQSGANAPSFTGDTPVPPQSGANAPSFTGDTPVPPQPPACWRAPFGRLPPLSSRSPPAPVGCGLIAPARRASRFFALRGGAGASAFSPRNYLLYWVPLGRCRSLGGRARPCASALRIARDTATRPRPCRLSPARTADGALRHPIALRFGSSSASAVVDFPEIERAPWGSGVPSVIRGGFLVCLRLWCRSVTLLSIPRESIGLRGVPGCHQ